MGRNLPSYCKQQEPGAAVKLCLSSGLANLSSASVPIQPAALCRRKDPLSIIANLYRAIGQYVSLWSCLYMYLMFNVIAYTSHCSSCEQCFVDSHSPLKLNRFTASSVQAHNLLFTKIRSTFFLATFQQGVLISKFET